MDDEDSSILQRLKRAKEQGFDVDNPVYHGSTSDFSKFDIDRKRGLNLLGKGVYSSPDPNVAETYTKNFTIMGDKGYDNVGSNIKPLFLRGKIFDMGNPEHRKLLPEDFRRTTHNLPDLVKELGFDHLKEPSVNHIVTFDPKNARSKFAQFDPSKVDSDDLAAFAGKSKFPKLGKALPLIGNVLDAGEIAKGNAVEGGIGLTQGALASAAPYIEGATGLAEGTVSRGLPALDLLRPTPTVDQNKELEQQKDAENDADIDNRDLYKKLALQRMAYKSQQK